MERIFNFSSTRGVSWCGVALVKSLQKSSWYGVFATFTEKILKFHENGNFNDIHFVNFEIDGWNKIVLYFGVVDVKSELCAKFQI